MSQNPKLTKLNLPLLEAIGGPLIIANNSALSTLASLEHLAVVNATGRSAPAFGLPSLPVTHPSPHPYYDSDMGIKYTFSLNGMSMIHVEWSGSWLGLA